MSDNRVFVPRTGQGLAEHNIITLPPNGEPVKDSPLSATELYRFENYIPIVTDMAVDAYRQRGADEPFTVLSVGCSIGAEVDTVLSHVTKVAPDIGSVVIRGYDISNDALKWARGGQYQIICWPGEDISVLDLFDLTLLPKRPPPELKGEKSTDDCTRYLADSNRLRAPHDVAFENRNLEEAQEPGTVPMADLLLCNRVLEHLRFVQIAPLVMGMTPQVRPGGFLSIGAIPHQWEQDRIAKRIQESGFEPILWTNWCFQESPFVYRRVDVGPSFNWGSTSEFLTLEAHRLQSYFAQKLRIYSNNNSGERHQNRANGRR